MIFVGVLGSLASAQKPAGKLASPNCRVWVTILDAMHDVGPP